MANSSTETHELRRIPKVELHRHLELTVRMNTLRELGTAAGLQIPQSDAELKKKLLITEPMNNLEEVLAKFLATQKLLHSEENLTRITFEAIEDAYNDGIRILELRYAPSYIRIGHENLSLDRIHKAIARGVEKASHLPIAVGLMTLIQRIMPLPVAQEITDFTIANFGRAPGDLVGIDLADNEAGSGPAPFAPFFQKAKAAGLHVTIHAGEDNFPGAPKNVRDSIELLGAERIGHGVQIHKDPEVMKFVIDRKIPLELCPTSNWLTNAVPSTAAHPFKKLMDQGVLVTLNSDDPGIFDIDLTHEYQVLSREHGFKAAEFTRINDIAASASFIPLERKQKFWPRPIDTSIAPLSNR
jgi:adenosine deaminase